ncbi:MAG: DUF6263 family protein [Psychroflexus maritimus]
MKKLITLTLLSVGLISCNQEDNIDLKLQLTEGETYQHSSKIKMDLNQKMMGQDVDLTMTIEGKMSFINQSNLEGSHELVGFYDYLSYETQMPQMQMKVSSDEVDAENPLSSIFNDMVGEKFNFNLSNQGRVSEVEGIDKIWTKLIAANENLSDLEKNQFQAQMQESFGADSFAGSLETSFAIYPEAPVKLGDSWTVTTNLQNGYPAQIKTTFTLKDFDEDFVYIEGEGNIKTEEEDNRMTTNGMEFIFSLEGSNTSELKLDRKTGWIVDGTVNQNAKGNMKFAEAPPEMEDQTIALDFTYLIELSNN